MPQLFLYALRIAGTVDRKRCHTQLHEYDLCVQNSLAACVVGPCFVMVEKKKTVLQNDPPVK
jgi:hypothetical protein